MAQTNFQNWSQKPKSKRKALAKGFHRSERKPSEVCPPKRTSLTRVPSNSPDHSALKIKPSELLSPCGWAQPWPSPRQSRLAQRWGCCCQAWDHLNRNTFPQLKTGITLTSHLSAELQWFSEPEDSETHSPPRWSRNLMSCGSEHPPLRPVSLFRRVIWPWWLLVMTVPFQVLH